jgi:ABC-type branched-subunit amino acid transport system permease subunit
MELLADLGFAGPVLVIAGYYAIFAIGLQVQVGHAGLLNFGQVAFMLVGAYVSAIAIERHGFSLVGGLLLGMAAAILAALVLAIPTVRLRGDFLAIAAIAAGEILRIIALNEQALTGGPRGQSALEFRREVTRPLRESVRDGGGDLDLKVPILVVTWTLVVVVGLAVWLLVRSPWGHLLRAMRDDEDAVRALGGNTFLLKSQALAIGAACAAIAGTLFAWDQTRIEPANFEPIVTFTGFIIIIAAGLGSIWGAVLMSIVIVGLFESTRFLATPFTSAEEAALRFIVIGVALMLIVGLRPQGLFGRRRELRAGEDG